MKSPATVAVWGAGGHAKVVAETLRALGVSVVCHIVDSGQSDQPVSVGRVPVVRLISLEDALRALGDHDAQDVVLGFGHCHGRLRVGEFLLSRGVPLAPVVHPSSVVSPSARLGHGVFVGAGCVVDPDVAVGDFTILNHRVTVCHDAVVGRACHLCPGVTVAGGCTIEDLCWLGVGTTIRDHVTVARASFVGAGSNVVANVGAETLVYGNPARPKAGWQADF